MGTSPKDHQQFLDNMRVGGGKDGTRPQAGRRRNQEESKMQAECVAWFRKAYPTLVLHLIAIPNARKATPMERRRWYEEGGVAGAADLFLAMPANWGVMRWGGLWLEAKTEQGVQRQTQKDFQATMLMRAMYSYTIFRSLDDFKVHVIGYLRYAGIEPLSEEEQWRHQQQLKQAESAPTIPRKRK